MAAMEPRTESATPGAEEDEDDYMNMVIAEPSKPKEKETYTQRRLRKEREAEMKRPKSKAELERLAAETREVQLAKPLHETEPSSKGLKMMQMMGFQAGGVLGKPQEQSTARAEPLGLQVKEDRGGIGLDSEKKRKVREAFEEESKRQKVEEGDYRDRVRIEREERRLEAQVLAAQKVAERLDSAQAEEGPPKDIADGRDPHQETDAGTAEAAQKPSNAGPDHATDSRHGPPAKGTPPLKHLPVVWRGLVRHRAEKERERRLRYDLQQSLSRVPTYDDADEDRDDRRALGGTADEKRGVLEQDGELDEEDAELDEFNALGPAERLGMLLEYLRAKHRYCFWCKFQYSDEALDGCPGVTEEEHD